MLCDPVQVGGAHTVEWYGDIEVKQVVVRFSSERACNSKCC